MSTFRVHKNRAHPYTIIDNTSINDKMLSAKAKGILLYLISKPDHWCINLPNLVSAFTDGKQSIRSGIKELIKFNYIVRSHARKEDGRFSYYEYLVFEHPLKSPLPHIPSSPESENRTLDNRTLLNTDNKESTERKKTTTTEAVNSNVDDDVSLNPDKEKINTLNLLSSLKIVSHRKLLKLFSIVDLFKYATWIKNNNFTMNNPTGFLISAIKEKWIEEVPESIANDDDKYLWYKCKKCKHDIGFLREMPDFTICQKCKNKLIEEKLKGGFNVTN
ncbi:hypothetical protein ES703_75116 [subsurface metagenome]